MRRTPRVLAVSLATLITCILGVGYPARADLPEIAALSSGTANLKGSVALQTVSGPACVSPTGLCFAGTIRGRLKGTVTIAAGIFLLTVDTPTTGVLVVVSDVTIELPDGNLLVREARLLRTTDGTSTAVWSIVGGSGALAGASGTLLLSGAAPGESSLSGTIVLP